MSKPRLDAGVPQHLAGRYQLLEKLADGAMTSVWRGHDQVLGRDVAVKLLHPNLAADERFAARFREEAVAAARLTHPGIVRVFDTGGHEGVPYIIMELVEGPTVRDMLRADGPMEPPRAARIAADVATALDYAHRLGVVHRDVKPANILVTPNGDVKVADFSLAKAADSEDSGIRTGETRAAAGYLAPEQLAGGPVDPRTDVYGLGACLYEMLTGRPPVKRTGAHAATAHPLTDVLPPRAVRAGVPRELDTIVLTALATDPAKRFQSAREMASALARFAGPAARPEVRAAPAPAPAHPMPISGGARTTATAPTLVPPPRGDGFLRQEGRYLGVTLLLVALCVVAFIAGLVLVKPEVLPGVTDRPATTATQPQARPVEARAISVLDRNDGVEHNEELPNATDGDPNTTWATDTYRNHSKFGNLKDGVGLILDAGSQVRATELELLAVTSGGQAEIRAANDPSGTIDAWELVADGRELGERVTYKLRASGDGYRYWMVWLTDLPPAGEGRYRAEIREVRLRS